MCRVQMVCYSIDSFQKKSLWVLYRNLCGCSDMYNSICVVDSGGARKTC